VLAEKAGKGVVALKDGEVLPEKVMLSEFKGTRPFYMRFTRKQCHTALRMMINQFRKPESQHQLSKLEKLAAGNAHRFRASVGQILQTEAYPAIFRRYGLPEEKLGPLFFMEAVGNWMTADQEMSELWLQVAVLIRNWHDAGKALFCVNSHRKANAEPLISEQDLLDIQKFHCPSVFGSLTDASSNKDFRILCGASTANNSGVEPQARSERTRSESPMMPRTGNELFDFDDLDTHASSNI